MQSESDFYTNELSGTPSLQSPADPLSPGAPTATADRSGKTPAPAKRRRTGFTELLIVSVVALFAAVVTQKYVIQVYAISGQSMMPTLNDSEMVMIHKLSPSVFEIDRGDIVIFNSPTQPGKDLIKRVIALPGDHLQIRDDEVWINDVLIDEPYAHHDLADCQKDLIVPPGKIYVLGDNRPQSSDSRTFSFVPIESVRGEVFLRFWPLRTMTGFP